MDVPKVVSDVLLHFRVDGFSVRRDLFPVFQNFRSRYNLPLHVSFLN